jgi:two-component system, OmpR family, sensor kinase
VAALLVTGSVAWLIARTIASPVARLQLAVRELARGRVDTRVPASITKRRDELGALALDFNSMATQLQELLAGREQLMAELSHELRSPLARLQAATALAAQRPGAHSADAARVELEIQRIDRVIRDLLRYSRLGAVGAVSRSLVRIDAVIRELVSDEELEARARGCDIRVGAVPELLVVGDAELLRSAFENILRNAIRHAPAGSRIEVGAVLVADQIHVTIADGGPGVPAHLLQQIFEPYFRVPGTAGGGDGTGLGLAITRRVVEAHGGGVLARPGAQGGLCVEVRLPTALSDQS